MLSILAYSLFFYVFFVILRLIMAINSPSPRAKTIIIYGATGDLATRKIFPALFQLFLSGTIGKHDVIVGFSRRPWNDEQFQSFLATFIKAHPDRDRFFERVRYHQGAFDNWNSFLELSKKLEKRDSIFSSPTEKVHYLSISPHHYETVIKNIAKSRIIVGRQRIEETIVIEKPFGLDRQSALNLNSLLLSFFDERRIMRVDHYLVKAPVKAVELIRLNNSIFKEFWN